MCLTRVTRCFCFKNCLKTMQNSPKSCLTMCLIDLLYKTVLWCFLFDFMLISNGTGHSFIVFLYIKEEINIFEYFWKTCKKPLFKQNFSLIKVNFGQLGLKFRTNHWAIFSRKKSPNTIKNHPNGEILPNLVTLCLTNLNLFRTVSPLRLYYLFSSYDCLGELR